MHAYLTGKTPLCGETRAGEPLRCAKVNPHTPVDPLGFGEPYNYHIVNRYFDEFLLKAVVLANASRGTDMYVRCSVASLYTLLHINIYTPEYMYVYMYRVLLRFLLFGGVLLAGDVLARTYLRCICLFLLAP